MNLHLAEISQAVTPDAHAVLLMDQAGWHTSNKLWSRLSCCCHAWNQLMAQPWKIMSIGTRAWAHGS